VEIFNILDDHSRLAIASLARRSIGGPDVVDTFTTAFTRWGTPASVLTDNGAIFTGAPRRGGRTALEITLGELGIRYLNSRPYHPPTCGKIERFHQTQKKWLTAHPAATLAQLQTLLDEFTDYYNRVRPHRAHRHSDPDPGLQRPTQGHRDRLPHPRNCRVRTDVIDAACVITIRYNSHLHHIGLSKRRRGTKVTVLIDDRDIRVLDRHTGQLIRKLVLDPTRDYQHAASNAETHPKTGCRCKPCLGTPVNDVPRHDSVPPAGLEPAGTIGVAGFSSCGFCPSTSVDGTGYAR